MSQLLRLQFDLTKLSVKEEKKVIDRGIMFNEPSYVNELIIQ